MKLSPRQAKILSATCATVLYLACAHTAITQASAFKVLGSEFLNASFVFSVDQLLELLAPLLKMKWDCQEIATEEGTLLTNSGIGHAKFLYSNCTVYFETTPGNFATCKPYPTKKDIEAGTNKGRLIGENLLIAFLHEGEAYLLLEGKEIEGKEGPVISGLFDKKECPFAAGSQIRGSLVFSLSSQEEVFAQLLKAASKELFSEGLRYGINEVIFHGSFWMSLVGAHSGYTWGVV